MFEMRIVRKKNAWVILKLHDFTFVSYEILVMLKSYYILIWDKAHQSIEYDKELQDRSKYILKYYLF